MSRVPDLDPEKLSPEQRKVYDAILSGPRGHVVGPLRVWLQSAELADRAAILDMGEVVFSGDARHVLDNAELRADYLAV